MRGKNALNKGKSTPISEKRSIYALEMSRRGAATWKRGKNALNKGKSASVSEKMGIFAPVKGAGCRSISIFII
ncbi:hypothetical protein [Paenibacillus odorifer]|uniref:Uncharacterized protein n=1 Tax=Paenibacillus odorifer TaxID=189426 RepID=A0ABX3GFD7_9BACL|nr:hypothetical protein [Paenibacillus odorifer]OMD04614.1 hypothetical protein BSO21_31795 [Paenibacillus odorifer]